MSSDYNIIIMTYFTGIVYSEKHIAIDGRGLRLIDEITGKLRGRESLILASLMPKKKFIQLGDDLLAKNLGVWLIKLLKIINPSAIDKTPRHNERPFDKRNDLQESTLIISATCFYFRYKPIPEKDWWQ